MIFYISKHNKNIKNIIQTVRYVCCCRKYEHIVGCCHKYKQKLMNLIQNLKQITSNC